MDLHENILAPKFDNRKRVILLAKGAAKILTFFFSAIKIMLMSQIEFNKNFSKLESILYGFAFSLTHHKEDAKDLFQETAFRAVKNRDKFQVGTNFKAWSMTIMKNIFINNYRKKIKANIVNDHTDNNFLINSCKSTINNQAEGNIMMKELKRMISKLEDTIRIPFLMHYEGYKYQEIADFMHLPIGTVKSRLFFARKELKEEVKRRYEIKEI